MGFLWFFLGMLTGGFLGVITLCLFQAGRCDSYEEKKSEGSEEKTKKD